MNERDDPIVYETRRRQIKLAITRKMRKKVVENLQEMDPIG